MKGLPSLQRSQHQLNYLQWCFLVCQPFTAKTTVLKDVEEPTILRRTKAGEFCRELPISDHLSCFTSPPAEVQSGREGKKGIKANNTKGKNYDA